MDDGGRWEEIKDGWLSGPVLRRGEQLSPTGPQLRTPLFPGRYFPRELVGSPIHEGSGKNSGYQQIDGSLALEKGPRTDRIPRVQRRSGVQCTLTAN